MSRSSSEHIMFGPLHEDLPSVRQIGGRFWLLDEGCVQLVPGPARNYCHDRDDELALATEALIEGMAELGPDIQIQQRYHAIPTADGQDLEYALQGRDGRLSFVLTQEMYRRLDSARRMEDGGLGILTIIDFSVAERMGYGSVIAALSSLEDESPLAWAPLQHFRP